METKNLTRYKVLKFVGPEEWVERSIKHPQRYVQGKVEFERSEKRIEEVDLEKTRMPRARLNELVNGPLSHPISPFVMTRILLALAAVLDATGEMGAAALEAHCTGLDRQDERLPDAG